MANVLKFKGKPTPLNPWREEALQCVLDLGDMPEAVLLWLNAKLRAEHDRRGNEPKWRWVAVTANPEMVGEVLDAIKAGPRPFSTLAVWTAMQSYLKVNDNTLICSQRTLAGTARVSRGDVARALQQLVAIGALDRPNGRGYRIHPTLVWHGHLAKREEAEAKAAPLALGKRKLALVEK